MNRFRILGALFVALIALSAVASAASAAETPEYLPASGTFPQLAKEISLKPETKATFEIKGNALKVVCNKVELGKGKVEFANAKGGPFDILFLECVSSGQACTGLTDTTVGSILVTGTTDLRFSNKEPLTAVTALLLNEAHFECAGLLISVRGCVAGTINPLKTATSTFTQIFTGPKGEQSITSIFNAAGTAKEPCVMEAEFNGNPFALASENASGSIIAKENATLDD